MNWRPVLFIFVGPFRQSGLIIDELTILAGMGTSQAVPILYVIPNINTGGALRSCGKLCTSGNTLPAQKSMVVGDPFISYVVQDGFCHGLKQLS